jgi:hypothetical protein
MSAALSSQSDEIVATSRELRQRMKNLMGRARETQQSSSDGGRVIS